MHSRETPARYGVLINFGFIVLFFVGTLSATSSAQIPADEMFRTTEQIRFELHNFCRAMMVPTESGIRPRVRNRRPRHLVQKLLEIHLLLQDLRSLKQLAPLELKPFQGRSDGKRALALAEETLRNIRELRPTFGIRSGPPRVGPSGPKTTDDVYESLRNISEIIRRLGVPETMPNSVFAFAELVRNEFSVIASREKISTEGIELMPATSKAPSDVYRLSLRIFELLSVFERERKLKVPGGILPPTRPLKEIVPHDVLDALGNLLAELRAIKHALGIRTATPAPSRFRGKQPSDVFDSLSRSLELAKRLNRR